MKQKPLNSAQREDIARALKKTLREKKKIEEILSRINKLIARFPGYHYGMGGKQLKQKLREQLAHADALYSSFHDQDIGACIQAAISSRVGEDEETEAEMWFSSLETLKELKGVFETAIEQTAKTGRPESLESKYFTLRLRELFQQYGLPIETRPSGAFHTALKAILSNTGLRTSQVRYHIAKLAADPKLAPNRKRKLR